MLKWCWSRSSQIRPGLDKMPSCISIDIRRLGLYGLELQARLRELNLPIIPTRLDRHPDHIKAVRDGAINPCPRKTFFKPLKEQWPRLNSDLKGKLDSSFATALRYWVRRQAGRQSAGCTERTLKPAAIG